VQDFKLKNSGFCVMATQTSIYYFLPGIVLDSRARFSLILREKGTIWYRLCTDLVYNKTVIHLSDVSVKSSRYLPRREISTTIHLYFGE